MTESAIPVLKLQVAEAMRGAMQRLADGVQDVAGRHLLGLAAYGDVVSGEFDSSWMTADSVIVLERFDLGLLRRLAEQGQDLGRKGLAVPLVMTPTYITASLDAFPLEFLEIQQRHVMLLGPDPFSDLKIDRSHLRVQVERELKVILIRLRQGLVAAAGDEGRLGDLEFNVAQHLLRTLSGLLWLHGRHEGLTRRAALAACEEQVGRPLTGLRGALSPDGELGWAEYSALYHDAETLAEMVEGM